MKKLILIFLLVSLFVPAPAMARDSERIMRFDMDKDGDIDLIDLLWWLRRDGWTGWEHMFGEPSCDCDETVGGGGGGGAG